ncbi:MAG: succinylglutamate desuccinylase/aspartoacylase family protein [Halobacteriovoraceae bacterium]|nr:succinylglutamate desuccinylase/aspartoacylase family protein [Halobacteriovoraceae bacterium]
MFSDIIFLSATHGNEPTGVYYTRNYIDQLREKFPNFRIHVHEANKLALQNGVRYIDEDLNRILESEKNENHETKEFEIFKNKFSHLDQQSTFIIDLHSATSNMHSTLVNSRTSSVVKKIISNVKNDSPDTFIIETIHLDNNSSFLSNYFKHGILLEFGPIAHNTISHFYLEKMDVIVNCILTNILNINHIYFFQYEFFKVFDTIVFPNNFPDFTYYIPKTVNDFKLINKNDPLLISPTRPIIYAQNDFYPIFVNESSYFDKRIAMLCCQKLTMDSLT